MTNKVEYLPAIRGNVPKLRETLELILEDCENEVQDGDTPIQAFQKLDLQISNAAAKNGINIFQMQQVNVTKIHSQAIKALALIKEIEKEQNENRYQDVSLDVVIERIAELGLTLKQFKNLMTSLYVNAVIKLNDDNKTKASKVLDIQRTYLSRILGTMREKKELAK